MGPAQHVLDLGCGNGMISEYLSDKSGACITGLDYISLAIAQACCRTAQKADLLSFIVGDINDLSLPDKAFDLILSIDSIYFSQDYAATLRTLKASLSGGGQMAFLYSQGREPWVPVDEFPRESILPDQSPLAKALQANDLVYRTWDLTSQDYALAQRRKSILLELKLQFEAEGNLFIYENRMGDAEGVSQAIEEGLHARYLYLAHI
jgi:cyclopropane fatty-acyl-phospholipid synthase-like methyltransferase